MKLYAHPATPRQQPFYRDVPTPASAYALQQLLQRAYREVLREWWDLDDLILAVFGPRTGKRLQALEDRLEHQVVEIMHLMSPTELEQAARVFCEQTLVGFVWFILDQEKVIKSRFKEGEHAASRLSDDNHATAAALGKGQPMRRLPMPEPEPCLSAVILPPRPCPVSLRPAPSHSSATLLAAALDRLHLRVSRAQERRRLKRKRR